MVLVNGPTQIIDTVSSWADKPVSTLSGNITGTVLNADTGAPIPDILVTAGGAQGLTDSAGRFQILGLRGGTHNLVAYALDGTYQTFQQGATVAEMQAKRKAAQPTNKRTFGSVFKNPEHELSAGRMLEACGLKGHRIGGAQISPRHANFIENAGEGRAAEAVALMAEARRRALEEFGVELEREVRFVGALELPVAGQTV